VSLKDYVRDDAEDRPENYGLSAEPIDEELDQLENRIRSIGITSEELRNEVDLEE